MLNLADEAEVQKRQRELEASRIEEEKRLEEERKNRGFTQVYSKGWKRVRELSAENSGAAGLYAMFAEHIDSKCGAVLCDQQFLADHMKVTTRTIRRWLDYLEEKRAIVRIPVAGKVCAYALDPREVWKGYNTNKEYAAFITRTLVNSDNHIKQRLMAMFAPDESA